jgi:hypothetical protein
MKVTVEIEVSDGALGAVILANADASEATAAQWLASMSRADVVEALAAEVRHAFEAFVDNQQDIFSLDDIGEADALAREWLSQ